MTVTGANGVLGGYVHRVFPDATLTGRATLDVTSLRSVREGIDGADVVLHLAAATDVDACELQPEMAFRVNTLGTRNVAAACKETGAAMVYVSTAGVFDGDTIFTELDTPHPANMYGITKLAGELAARAICENLIVVRSGWMMGGGPTDSKFVGKIRRQLDAGATEILAVSDKRGSPTYALDFLEGIKEILDRLPFGTYHGANEGSATRYDVAVETVRLLGSGATVTAVSSDAFPLPAPRSDSEVLGTVNPLRRRPWREALAAYLKENE